MRLSERPPGPSHWDERAPFFEHVDAIAARDTGLFGAPVNIGAVGMVMLGVRGATPSTLPAAANPEVDPTIAAALSSATMLVQTRLLKVDGVPATVTSKVLRAFINGKMNEKLMCSSGHTEPCYEVMLEDGGHATLAFRHADEATNALTLDGVYLEGYPLSLSRPRDYVGPDVVAAAASIPTTVPDGPNKLFIGNVPLFLGEGQVMELLQAFGELRCFDLIRDEETQKSRGIAFCEFVEETSTEMACEGLDGLEVGEQRLLVRRLAERQAAAAATEAAPQETSDTPTRAMVLLNMVTMDELLDDAEYADIVEDVRVECSRHGTVEAVYIPRPLKPGHDGVEPPGVGRVYVRFAAQAECEAALHAVAGRQFDGRTVICAFVRDDAWPDRATAP